MQESIRRLNPVAVKCIRNAFQIDPEQDEMVAAIYATIPGAPLIRVFQIKSDQDIHEFEDGKFAGIPVIPLRVSNVEFEYLLRLM